jgi:hypothetical protein
LTAILESDIQLLALPALSRTLALEEKPEIPIEYPIIETVCAPDDGSKADLTLEMKILE